MPTPSQGEPTLDQTELPNIPIRPGSHFKFAFEYLDSARAYFNTPGETHLCISIGMLKCARQVMRVRFVYTKHNLLDVPLPQLVLGWMCLYLSGCWDGRGYSSADAGMDVPVPQLMLGWTWLFLSGCWDGRAFTLSLIHI